MGDDADLDAGTAVVTALRAIVERMRELEVDAVADEPDAVHQLRTHVRRVRSVLAAYEPVFDAAPAVVLRRRYGELGDELGVVRDIEVRVLVAERALDEASEQGLLSDAAQAGSVRARLIDTERENYRLTHARFVERQRLPRAMARRDELEAFLADPPLTPLAADPARKVIAALVDDEAHRALRRAERAHGAHDTEALHDLRKAGRRLRYAAEAVTTDPVELFDGRIRSLA